MMSKKRRRQDPPSIHPRNKYSETSPDFAFLASLYPSFQPFVFISKRNGRPTIDWTDFNATRELTRVLLLHDHGVHWWIPDGQLCPTVPNRSNYVHWIEDLLSSELIPPLNNASGKIRGFDIGTGANCIYPLIGASLLGWSFVGSDFTEVALEWAKKNLNNNPHLSDLIEIRNANDAKQSISSTLENAEPISDQDQNGCLYDGPPMLAGVVKDGEYFDFCMCNPPFFESMDAAGLNPKTACGGTSEEMVCRGGERAFILRIIRDSVKLKHAFRWFTSMVGRKANLKFLISKLREVGVTIVKTTDFVQGQTCRWGLAWSFISPSKKVIAPNSMRKNHSFMLEGRPCQLGAFQVLQSIESFFQPKAATCKSEVTSFSVNVTISSKMAYLLVKDEHDLNPNDLQPDDLTFRVTVFEQIPGTLLVKGALSNQESSFSGLFASLFLQLEETLKKEFLSKRQEKHRDPQGINHHNNTQQEEKIQD